MKTMREKIKQYFSFLGKFLFGHIMLVPYILFCPVTAVINLLFSLTSYMYDWLDDSFGTFVTNQKRLTRLTRKAVRTVLGGHSNIMSSFASYRVSLVFTFLLQIISFLTTYAGFTFFLKNISPFAPLLLAIVVQGTFYFLINSRSTRKREGNWKRWILLALALSMSTTTSFVGISNTVRSPVEEMKSTYESYRTKHNEQIDAYVDSVSSKLYDTVQIESMIHNCGAVLRRSEAVLNRLSSEIPSEESIIIVERTVVVIGTDENGYPITRTITNTRENEELRNKKSKLTGLIKEIETTLKWIHNDFGNPVRTLDVVAISKVCNGEFEDSTDKSIYDDFINYLNAHAELEYNLNKAENELGDDLSASQHNTIDPDSFPIINTSKIDNALSISQNAKMDSYDSVVDAINKTSASASISSFLSTVNDFFNDIDIFLVSPGLSQAETIRKALNEEMDTKFQALNYDIQDQLGQKYRESKLPSSQLYPFRYLLNFSDPDWGSSVLSFVLAVAVDLFSVILAFSLIKRRDSILYARSHRENVRNREEILEDCYTYLCLKKLPSISKKKKIRTKAEIQALVTKTIDDILIDFIRLVHVCYLPEELDSFGFISESKVHKEFDPNLSDLFQTLRLIHLIRPTTKGELTAILSASFPIPEKSGSNELSRKIRGSFNYKKVSSFPKAEIEQIPDEVLYLVDNRLLMWYNESLSELFESTMISDEIGLSMQEETAVPNHEVKKKLEEKAEMTSRTKTSSEKKQDSQDKDLAKQEQEV